MKKNIVKEKSFDFALRIVNLYKYLCKKYQEFVLSKQLLRSGTAIGALIREAEHAESKADFIPKGTSKNPFSSTQQLQKPHSTVSKMGFLEVPIRWQSPKKK